MKKRRSSKSSKKVSNNDTVQSNTHKLEKSQVKTQAKNSNNTMWKVDEANIELNDKAPLEQESIEFRDALAKSIIDQTDLGIKENIESIKPENLDNINAMLPRKRHLLVPINVQSLVVPTMTIASKGDKTKSSRNQSVGEVEANDKQKIIKTYPKGLI